MAHPPFINSYGLVAKILEKIKVAATPPRFTIDFLGTQLGFSGGSARPFIGVLKRIGFLGSDGVPTQLYKRFRNSSESGKAMAEALRIGFAELYKRNEYAHSLSRSELSGLVTEITGLEGSSSTVGAIVGTFESLKTFADFSQNSEKEVDDVSADSNGKRSPAIPSAGSEHVPGYGQGQGLNLNYTINLVLPETTDIAVFSAIFKSISENLLKR